MNISKHFCVHQFMSPVSCRLMYTDGGGVCVCVCARVCVRVCVCVLAGAYYTGASS